MRIFQRSHWTSIPPQRGGVGDDIRGLHYFDERPTNVSFYTPKEDILFVYRNPVLELTRLLKEKPAGYSDIDFNFAIAQNTEGVYILRGFMNKCNHSKDYKCLVLVGENEVPTDVLKENVQNLRELLTQPVGYPLPVTPLKEGEHNIHVFDLIEYLFLTGYYAAKNDGYYGGFTRQAVQKFQQANNLPITGEWDEWCVRQVSGREYLTFVS